MRHNPYYNPSELGLELISFDEPHLSYEYNTLCFWATGDGRVFSASDSGCSCPTPFDQYRGDTQDEVIQQLEQVGSPEQAVRIFANWNRNFLDVSEQNEAELWVKNHLTNQSQSVL